MRYEVVHIDDCPNWSQAGERLRAALAATGHGDDQISFRLIRDPGEADAMGFAGSPTLLADGTDLFPTTAVGGAIACRVYETPNGLAGLPTVEQIADAIRNRRGSRA
jgi:hypothetical protein